ncbi:MAG TPA: DNA translocase FtsK, partial [Anaerolineae bacterium]
STSLLQRRFRIGYTRAARIIDAMEAQDIIGPPTGTSKAREVLPAEEVADSEEQENESEGQEITG